VDMDYSISMWNYAAYFRPATLEEAVQDVSQAGFGIEMWPWWKTDTELFAPENRKRLLSLLSGVSSSLHSGGINRIEDFFQQVEAAAESRSSVLVVHADQLRVADEPDFCFAQEVSAYARDKGVILALENGQLHWLVKAVEKVDGLEICLDTGHVYCGNNFERPMQEFVGELKWRIRHLHLQDLYLEPGTRRAIRDSHKTPGMCDIPREDYEYLFSALVEVGFAGTAVLEVRPFDRIEIALQSQKFFGLLTALP
jgi:sugar phosphate isomerase/epimerase